MHKNVSKIKRDFKKNPDKYCGGILHLERLDKSPSGFFQILNEPILTLIFTEDSQNFSSKDFRSNPLRTNLSLYDIILTTTHNGIDCGNLIPMKIQIEMPLEFTEDFVTFQAHNFLFSEEEYNVKISFNTEFLRVKKLNMI